MNDWLKTLLIGGVVVAYVNHNYNLYRQRKHYRTVIEILRCHDLEIREANNNFVSIVDVLTPMVEYLYQQDIDNEFEKIMNKYDDLG